MRKSYQLLAGLALMSAFTACNNEDEVVAPVNDTKAELVVNTVGVAEVNTKSGIRADKFTNQESLGLYIYRGDLTGDYNDDARATSTVNVEYKVAVDNTTWSAPTQPIILSNIVGNVFAYYPYAAGNDTQDGTAIPITVAASQGTGQSDGVYDQNGQIDYMYATKVPGVSNVKPGVQLTMNHALSMASFVFVQTDDATLQYPGIGQVSKIVVKNADSGNKPLKTGDGTMNISTGVVTGGTEGTITVEGITTPTLLDEDDASLVPHILMYPAETVAGGDVKLTATVDGNEYTVDLPVVTGGWLAGKNYQYTLTMKGTALEVKQVTITQWGNIEVNQKDDTIVQKPDNQS